MNSVLIYSFNFILVYIMMGVIYGDVVYSGIMNEYGLGIIEYYVEYECSIWSVVSIIGLLVSNKIVFDLAIIIGNVMDMYSIGWMCIVVVGWMYMCMNG